MIDRAIFDWQVYAVEGSAMAEMAQKLVDHNGVAEVVEVINERLENITLPDRVDLIISEWMGTALLVSSVVCTALASRRERYCTELDSSVWSIVLVDICYGHCHEPTLVVLYHYL